MDTNFISKKQVNYIVSQLTNIKNTQEIRFIKNKEDALECFRQHSFWLSGQSNNNLLHWMFRHATNDDLRFVGKQFQNEIFTDKFNMIISMKTFGIQHLSVKHEDCVRYMIFNNICQGKDKLLFTDKIVQYGDISLLKLLIEKKYPITSYTFAAAIKSDNIKKVQLLVKSKIFTFSDIVIHKIAKESKSSVILVYLHELYNFDVEKIGKTIIDNNLIEFVKYCKDKNLLNFTLISKLIRMGGIKWITILENYVDLSILFRMTANSKHMEPYFRFIIQNYDVWTIPHLDNFILEIQEDNIIKTLVYNIPTRNNHLKESVILIISQYILDVYKKELYISHILD